MRRALLATGVLLALIIGVGGALARTDDRATSFTAASAAAQLKRLAADPHLTPAQAADLLRAATMLRTTAAANDGGGSGGGDDKDCPDSSPMGRAGRADEGPPCGIDHNGLRPTCPPKSKNPGGHPPCGHPPSGTTTTTTRPTTTTSSTTTTTTAPTTTTTSSTTTTAPTTTTTSSTTTTAPTTTTTSSTTTSSTTTTAPTTTTTTAAACGFDNPPTGPISGIVAQVAAGVGPNQLGDALMQIACALQDQLGI